MEDIILNCDCIDLLTNHNFTIDLSVIDPPYFRILKGEKWDKFKDYTTYFAWCEQWVNLIAEKTRYSGCALLYGCSRNFDVLSDFVKLFKKNGFYFVEEIVIDKGIKSYAGRISSKIKMLPPVSENILVFRKDAKPFVKSLLQQKQKEYGYSAAEIKERLGMATNGGGNWTKYCGDTEFPILPIREHWEKLQELFSIDIPYPDIEEVYNGELGMTNVWADLDFNSRKKRTSHPTEKPIALSERLIRTFSRESDTVFVPFLGSGSEMIACHTLNRRCVGAEINRDYFTSFIASAV